VYGFDFLLMVCMALICFLSTECVASIYVLGINYHVLGINNHILPLFTLIYGFSVIEVYIKLKFLFNRNCIYVIQCVCSQEMIKCSDKWIVWITEARTFIYRAPLKYPNRTYTQLYSYIVCLLVDFLWTLYRERDTAFQKS